MNDTAGVIICAFTPDRWTDLKRAVDSVVSQRPPPTEVIVVIDHHDELLHRAQARWPSRLNDGDLRLLPRVVSSVGSPGLSGARNTGVAASTADIVFFLDDDATATKGWLASLLPHYEDAGVLACGGAAVPHLAVPRPSWWPPEFDWIVGCSYIGMPTEPARIRNLIGANMSVRRSSVLDLGGFSESMGRVGSTPLGCEETDLFIRLARRWPNARIIYEPSATVSHSVPAPRLTWSYFSARCYAEGVSKARLTARVGSTRALSSERRYATRTLPAGIGRGVIGGIRGHPREALPAIAIIAGLAITTAGYLWGWLTFRAVRLEAIRGP